MRNAVVRALTHEASANADIHLLTADLGFRVLDPFREAHPSRFTNVGVSEANMVTLAAGMALTGKRPFCYSMVPFVLMRAFEQFRLDVVAQRQPVTLIGVGGGLSYGHEGVSHHAIEDLAILRSLPGLQVLVPGDPSEAEAAVRAALGYDGPTFIRLGQNNDPKLHAAPVDVLRHPLHVRGESSEFVVFTTGHIAAVANEACERLAASANTEFALFTVPCIKPFDATRVVEIVRKARVVVTIEEHSLVGGLGTAVMEALFAARWSGRFERFSLPDSYCEMHGTLPWLRKQYRLDTDSIAERLQDLVK